MQKVKQILGAIPKSRLHRQLEKHAWTTFPDCPNVHVFQGPLAQQLAYSRMVQWFIDEEEAIGVKPPPLQPGRWLNPVKLPKSTKRLMKTDPELYRKKMAEHRKKLERTAKDRLSAVFKTESGPGSEEDVEDIGELENLESMAKGEDMRLQAKEFLKSLTFRELMHVPRFPRYSNLILRMTRWQQACYLGEHYGIREFVRRRAVPLVEDLETVLDQAHQKQGNAVDSTEDDLVNALCAIANQTFVSISELNGFNGQPPQVKIWERKPRWAPLSLIATQTQLDTLFMMDTASILEDPKAISFLQNAWKNVFEGRVNITLDVFKRPLQINEDLDIETGEFFGSDIGNAYTLRSLIRAQPPRTIIALKGRSGHDNLIPNSVQERLRKYLVFPNCDAYQEVDVEPDYQPEKTVFLWIPSFFAGEDTEGRFRRIAWTAGLIKLWRIVWASSSKEIEHRLGPSASRQVMEKVGKSFCDQWYRDVRTVETQLSIAAFAKDFLGVIDVSEALRRTEQPVVSDPRCETIRQGTRLLYKKAAKTASESARRRASTGDDQPLDSETIVDTQVSG
eukprot:Clim_evm75s153 gene=Clim_evmTU75s153